MLVTYNDGLIIKAVEGEILHNHVDPLTLRGAPYKEISRVAVWSKEGSFQRDFKTKYVPNYIAATGTATGDNHWLIASFSSNTVMVYTLGGQLVHDPERFSVPYGICVDDSGTVYVAESCRVQVF